MKRFNILFGVLLSFQCVNIFADHHLESSPLSTGAMTILNLVAEDPAAYTEFQKGNAEVFASMGAMLGGACVAVSGNDAPGEMQMFTFFPNLESAFGMWDMMATSPTIKNIQTDLRGSRELTGNQTLQIINGYEGEIYETWATRTVEVNPTNPAAYLQAVSALDAAYKQNGFSDIEFDVYQSIASGNSASHTVIAVAPSLARLGAAFDALSAERWAQDAYALVTASRSAPVSDKAYRCEQVYSAI
jgi:hypothetical protein